MGTTETFRLVLASASPARLKTLQAAGIEPEVLVSGVDESIVDSTSPETLSLTLGRLKAEAVAERLHRAGRAGRAGHGSAGHRTVVGDEPNQPATGPTGPLVLGCDSVLAFDGEILGKPADADDATKRWLRMRGRSGVLHTGHCLIDLASGGHAEAVASTVVHFADVDDEEIAAYVATGEPLHVAGAFTIDGLGGPFVERIEGDPGTVVGLSLPLLRGLLGQLGIRIVDLWQRPAGG